MGRGSQSRVQGYTLDRAIDDVFGRRPLGPWSAVASIAVGGVVGALASSLVTPAGATPHPALRWAACAGYGMVVAALVTVLPRAGRLTSLRSALAKRPNDDGGERPWWPLRLLAAALRGTPGLRRTQQDFDAAVDRAGPNARSILAHRLWPAWVTAFVVPVLGLLSAWEAGKQIEVVDGQNAAELLMQFVPLVSPPMVATIAAALGLMVVLAVLDQATKGLLQRWAATVRFTDDATPVVTRLLDEPPLPRGGAGGDVRDLPPPGPGPVPGPVPGGDPQSGPTVADLEAMAGEFSNRGRNS